MARFEFKLPDIGEGVAEGEIVAWHVKPGDVVKEDQAMVEVMTDKATVTIGAPKKGTILETCAAVGQVLPVGTLLVVIETEGGPAIAPAPSTRPVASTRPAASMSTASSSAPAPSTPAPRTAAPSTPAPGTAAPGTAAAGTSAAGTSAAGTSAAGIAAAGTSAAGTSAAGTSAATTGAMSTPAASTAAASKAASAPAASTALSTLRSAPAPAASTKVEAAATAVGDLKDTLPGAGFFAQNPAVAPALPKTRGANGHAAIVCERPLATPATRKLARELDVDLRRVPATGPNGRVTLDDVRAFAQGAPTASAPAIAPGPAIGARSAHKPIAISPPPGTSPSLEERRPFVGVRRRIAERMQQSKQTAAHFTFVEECDVGRLKDMRKRLQGAAEKQGVKLSFLPFIAKAVVAALKKFPVLNSALDETTNELVGRRYYHLGIAASTDQGLMVPVVKDADKKSIVEIAKDIERLGAAAKAGTIQSADLSGSTFTITSLGAQGGLFATPVLNFPEVGILGVHQIKKKPVVRDDQIVIGEIMLLSLSFDHRIVDGHVGAAFAYEIIAYLEEPERLLLEMV